MKKVLIRAFVQQNLGDDLFIRILCERYPDVQFYIIGEGKYQKSVEYIKNLKYIRGDILPFKVLNAIYMKMPKNRAKENNRNVMLYNLFSRYFDENVYVTGSYFIESSYWNGLIDEKWYDNEPIIIGCNFGPYRTEQYYEAHKKQFAKTKLVSFRDRYSCELFKDLGNVEWHPDIIFNLQVPETAEENYYVITVVNVQKDVHVSESQNQIQYVEKMAEISNQFCKMGNKVVFLSFCSDQGDEQVIEEILNRVEDRNQIEVKAYSTAGMDEILKIIARCKGIVATRFHAMILGFLFGKNTLPIVYNEKMENVLRDLQYAAKWFGIEQIDQVVCDEIDQYFGRLEEEKLNKVIVEAEKHFSLLDKIIK